MKSHNKYRRPADDPPLQGRISYAGMDLAVENKKRTVREWGKKPDERTKMFYDYGYIRGTMGVDGDPVDIYWGRDREAKKVYIIHQLNPKTGKYDEDKCMLGFDSWESARDAYLAHYDSQEFLGKHTEMDVETFKEKVFKTEKKPGMIKSLRFVIGGLLRKSQMNMFEPGAIKNNPNLALRPSKKNPSVKRYQSVRDRDQLRLQIGGRPKALEPQQQPAKSIKDELPIGKVHEEGGRLKVLDKDYKWKDLHFINRVRDKQAFQFTKEEWGELFDAQAYKLGERYVKETGKKLEKPGDLENVKLAYPVEFVEEQEKEKIRKQLYYDIPEKYRQNFAINQMSGIHKNIVGQAILDGKDVPDEVISAYPEFKEQPETINEISSSEIEESLKKMFINGEYGENTIENLTSKMSQQQIDKYQDMLNVLADREEGPKPFGKWVQRYQTNLDLLRKKIDEGASTNIINILAERQNRLAQEGIENHEQKEYEVESGDDVLGKTVNEVWKAEAMSEEELDERLSQQREGESPGKEEEPEAQEGETKQFGGDDLRRLETTESGKKRWVDADEDPENEDEDSEEEEPEGDLFESQIQLEEPPKQTVLPENLSSNLNLWDAYWEFMKIARKENPVKADDIRTMYQSLLDNKENVKKQIVDRLNSDDKYKRKRTATKEKIADDTYDAMLERLVYLIKESYSIEGIGTGNFEESKIKAQKKIINEATDEQIAELFNKRKERIEETKRQIKNPITLNDYRTAEAYRKLTPEEIDRYEDLQAINRKEQADREKLPDIGRIGTDNLEIVPDKDTRDNSEIWVVKLKERVSAERFKEISSNFKKLGGYWSRYKGGFLFKNDPTAILQGDEEITPREKDTSTLRETAERQIEKAEEDLNRDRLANTARRARMANSAEADALRRLSIAKTMLNIADGIDGGDLIMLKDLSARTQVEELESALSMAKNKAIRANNEPYEKSKDRQPTIEDIRHAEMPIVYLGLNDALKIIDNNPRLKNIGKLKARVKIAQKNNDNYLDIRGIHEQIYPKIEDSYTKERTKSDIDRLNRLARLGINNEIDLRAALREYLSVREGGQQNTKADKIKKLERELIGTKIPGYFPTPKDVVSDMLNDASIEDGMTVLEPSAGKGNIADMIKDSGHKVETIEYNNTLRNILEEKGHDVVGNDFLKHQKKYDRIIMNPPFENGQDIDHVLHAYDLLNDGGRVVALMSGSTFSRSDKKAKEFQDWVESIGGTYEMLPEGSFKTSERPTGVSVIKVVIDKE